MNWKENIFYPLISPMLKGLIWSVSRFRLPQLDGRISLSGLSSSIDIYRDHWGVAHIYASSVDDVLFGQGFVHAQERLWQMDFTRRVVEGRLAEILGEPALGADRAMRTLGLRIAAEQDSRILSDKGLELLDSYCRGVNAGIELLIHEKKLPIEFLLLGYAPESWNAADSISWSKLMSWTLAANWQTELYRGVLVSSFGEEMITSLELDIDKAWAIIMELGDSLAGNRAVDLTRRFVGPRAGEGVGSNSWTIHGTRTTTGMPLLANDMHLELTSPGVWFENHLSGGDLEVTGVTMPGVPFVIAGHNRKVAWGFTDSCPDVQDLYEENIRVTGENSWEYEYRGEWIPVHIRHERIVVKGHKDYTEKVIHTRHGPVINILFKDAFPFLPPMALRWTALEPDHSFDAFLAMNQAGNCLEFQQALRNFDNPSQNVIYADTSGNIGYSMNGKIPIRSYGNGTMPTKGWTGQSEWIGYIPFDELPHIFNPPKGYIVTANNQIQTLDFPHFLGIDYLVSERAGRIVELLESNSTVDIPYIKKMHKDQITISSRILANHIGGLRTNEPGLLEEIINMRSWDGSLDAESREAAVFEATIRSALSLLLSHHFGELGLMIQGKGIFTGQWSDHVWEWLIHLLEEQDSPWFDLGHGEKRDDILLFALQKGINDLECELGKEHNKWTWGRLHQLTFTHVIGKQRPFDKVFNLGPYPIGGDGNSIWASFSNLIDLKNKTIVGPPFRFIADLNDLDHCWGILVPGQSGHLGSKHYKDGINEWFKGGYHSMYFSKEDVVNNSTQLLKIIPK